LNLLSQILTNIQSLWLCIKPVVIKTSARHKDKAKTYYYNSVTYTIILLLLFTAIGFSPGGSSPYTSTYNSFQVFRLFYSFN
jgi:hypothetical protein